MPTLVPVGAVDGAGSLTLFSLASPRLLSLAYGASSLEAALNIRMWLQAFARLGEILSKGLWNTIMKSYSKGS